MKNTWSETQIQNRNAFFDICSSWFFSFGIFLLGIDHCLGTRRLNGLDSNEQAIIHLTSSLCLCSCSTFTLPRLCNRWPCIAKFFGRAVLFWPCCDAACPKHPEASCRPTEAGDLLSGSIYISLFELFIHDRHWKRLFTSACACLGIFFFPGWGKANHGMTDLECLQSSVSFPTLKSIWMLSCCVLNSKFSCT